MFVFIRPGKRELYSLDPDLAKQLILSFSGSKTIYPVNNASNITQIKQIVKTRKQGELFNMYTRGLELRKRLDF